MATINGIKVFVQTEEADRETVQTSHPVEKGIDITDSIRNKPLVLSLSGKIVDTKKMKASEIESKLEKLRKNGSLIDYIGRKTYKNLQIKSFNCSYSNKTWGGADFSMVLTEIRVGKTSYNGVIKETHIDAKKEQNKKAPTLKVGATVVFKGGSVYVSSTASKPAAKRGRSTCKITYINLKGKHQYHLVSKDGGRVYGWCDKSNIEGTGSVSSSASKPQKAGTQQPSSNKKGAVYHTVKKGDTVYKLATVTYKKYGKSVKWIIDNNPHAFSRKGDPKTLQIGKKLLVGYK